MTGQMDLVSHSSDAERVLSLLRASAGEWVDRLYSRSGCMVHSRIADLRRRGFSIECKRFGRGDYRYRMLP